MTLLMLLGAIGGTGVLLILLALLPPAPVDLPASVAQIDTIRRGATPGSHWKSALIRLAERSNRTENRWWGTPSADLSLLGHSPVNYVARRLTYAVLGIAVGAVVAIRMAVPVLVLPVGVASAVLLSLLPWYTVRRAAARARHDFLLATAALFDLTAQERDAGRAPGQALIAAASVTEEGWAFAHIRSCLRSAQRTGTTPWAAISRLADDIGVDALQDLADIIASAADGAAVSHTLRTKASVLRNTAIEAEAAAANKRSEWLFAPVVLLVIGLLVLLLYPIFNQIPH